MRTFSKTPADSVLSPFTGMTREHWKDAAKYLLEGAFSYLESIDDPMIFTKQSDKTYSLNEIHNPIEMMEGLCRTLFIAAPLLKEEPDLVLNNINVANYYRLQITNLLLPSSISYIPPMSNDEGVSQKLVEFGGLSVLLFAAPEILWDPLSPDMKDLLADTMLSYGNGPTIEMNWRFFNIMILSFFKSRGYSIKDKVIEFLIENCLKDYGGDGWYNDSPYYDYYSMWSFQMYGVLWSEFFGRKNYPRYATKFLENLKMLEGTYPYMFGINGEMIMWGRSISYRMAASVPFPLMGMNADVKQNLGWMRKIASGTILQFLEHPHFLKDRIPTLGFYGVFEPAVQSYSCPASVFWLGKLFMGLLVPPDNIFWTTTENEGPWNNLFEKDKVYHHFSSGSQILITNYPNSGASEIRKWCYSKEVGSYEGTENYNRLSYNSAFPWQADGKNGEVAMNYVFKVDGNKWEALRMFVFKKFEDGVYYRNAAVASLPGVKIQLADIPISNGILRVDRVLSKEECEFRLGNYALPLLNDKEVKKESIIIKGKRIVILDNGEYQLATVAFEGWDEINVFDTQSLHPQGERSSVVNLSSKYYPEQIGKIYITLMLWKKSSEDLGGDDFKYIKKISRRSTGVDFLFRDGTRKNIRF